MQRCETPRRKGVLATIERVLSSEWTSLLAFVLLLTTFDLSPLQGVLAIIVFVCMTTKPADWVIAEREARKRARTQHQPKEAVDAE